MSKVDWMQRRALTGLVRSIRRLEAVTTGRQVLFSKSEAAERLGVSMKRLRLLIALDLVDTVKVGNREYVFLP